MCHELYLAIVAEGCKGAADQQLQAEACTALTSDTLSSLLTGKLACPLGWLCQRPLSTKGTSPPGGCARVLTQSTALILCKQFAPLSWTRDRISKLIQLDSDRVVLVLQEIWRLLFSKSVCMHVLRRCRSDHGSEC